MHISLGFTIFALSTAGMVQSFPTVSPISDAFTPQVLDLAIRSPSTEIDLYNSNSALEARQGGDWIYYGILVCNQALGVLKYVVILKGIQRVENLCRLYATNKNYKKDVQIRIQKGNGPKETFTVKAATCSAQINLVDVFYGDQFKLEIQQQ